MGDGVENSLIDARRATTGEVAEGGRCDAHLAGELALADAIEFEPLGESCRVSLCHDPFLLACIFMLCCPHNLLRGKNENKRKSTHGFHHRGNFVAFAVCRLVFVSRRENI